MPTRQHPDEPAGSGPLDVPARSLGRNLPVAIASGVALVVLYTATLLYADYAFLMFVALVVVLGLLELDAAFRSRGLRPATPVALGAGMVMLFGAYTDGAGAQTLGLVLLALGAAAWTMLDSGRGRVAASIGATCLMTVWVPFQASFLALLLARDQGPLLVSAVVALAVTTDIAAFAWGSRFGRFRLAPTVSPSKTWEGFAGAVLTVLVLAALVTPVFVDSLNMARATALGIGVALAATLGDLAESLIKRDLALKDLGRIIPGHGGIMDRVDGLVFALPVAHLILVAFGL